MKIKFNWGTGILLVILIFFGCMIGIIIFSFNQSVDLVSKDYYPKGIDYDKQIEKIKNLNQLGEKIQLTVNADSVRMKFPEYFKNSKISGTAQFYYITDFKKDKTLNFEMLKNTNKSFSISTFEKGRYIIKVDWTDSLKSYYQEIELNL
ncbi:MAG: FixH family protein [Bacteroidales bacterium]